MSELFLIRHAQASFGSENYDKLSELGHHQSSLLGEYFKQRNISFDHAVTGNMLRHRETAQGIVGDVDTVEIDSGWNEFDFQSIMSAYFAIHPEKKPPEGAPKSEFYKALKVAMLAWSQDALGPLQEDWKSFEARVENAATRVFNSQYKKVMVVSSGGAISVLLMQLLGLPLAKAIDFNLQIKNSSVHHFYFNKSSVQLSSFNNVPHLDHPERQHLISYS